MPIHHLFKEKKPAKELIIPEMRRYYHWNLCVKIQTTGNSVHLFCLYLHSKCVCLYSVVFHGGDCQV